MSSDTVLNTNFKTWDNGKKSKQLMSLIMIYHHQNPTDITLCAWFWMSYWLIEPHFISTVMTGRDFLVSEWLSQALFRWLLGLYCYDTAWVVTDSHTGFNQVTPRQVCVWISCCTVTTWPRLVRSQFSLSKDHKLNIRTFLLCSDTIMREIPTMLHI